MSHPNHREQLARLKRIHGQISGIIKMVESERYCVDILTQTRAARSALRRVEEGILGKHLEHCVAQALESGQGKARQQKLDEIKQVMRSFG